MNAATQDGDSFDSPDGRTYSEPVNAATPEQADEIPDIYARYLRTVYDLGKYPNEIAGRWEHMTGAAERKFWHEVDAAQEPRPAPELAKLRAELTELTRNHARLLEEILKNADQDISDADEAGEYVAEEYVRWLEAERRKLLRERTEREPLTVKPADDVKAAPELAAALDDLNFEWNQVIELRARLSSLTDRAEAAGVITGDEAAEYHTAPGELS